MDYEKILSQSVQSIAPSGIRKFFDLLEEMHDPDMVALTVGQPDFVTPWHIRSAAIESLESGKTYYTSNSGTMDLRIAISNYLSRRFDVHYQPKDEIIVTVGGSEAIDAAIRALVNPGDEVIIPQPAFVCYGPLVTMAGGVPVYLDLKEKNRFRLTAEELRGAITPKTKLLVLPFPSNPTGAIMERADLEAIAEVLRGTDIMVLSDEIYAELTYGHRHVSIASIDGMWERTVLASGFSKAYAMTGWRMGYVCAPAPVLNQIFKIHQYAIMCAPTTSQFAAIEALQNGDEDVAGMVAEYDRRRKYLMRRFGEIGLPCFEPEGAFYVFPNLSGFGMSSEEFCEKLLFEYKVAIVPGTALGACGEGFARISYAYSIAHLEKAVTRIGQMIEDLKSRRK
ncbi:MAG: aminotransferase class I/II-fold pyridoxal phosphate-dependent enzyme [Clostridia bacterium]|nr:aminotransferase class I/II-fold pyridoxal phosphate-dependent enzyme [Clostridia bacterium]